MRKSRLLQRGETLYIGFKNKAVRLICACHFLLLPVIAERINPSGFH